MADEKPRGTDHDDDSRQRRVRAIRSLEMPEEEVAARKERRARYLSLWGKNQEKATESSNNAPEQVKEQIGTTEAEASKTSGEPLVGVGGRKPWESLIIGNLGDNLSYIEQKDREIEQQKFIVQYHEEHSPHQVAHNRRILDQLIEERSQLEDNEENNMPQDQREKADRMSRRLELLRRTLDNSECDDERINIRAAIHGYESGQIPYSDEFTLLYAGHIVDRCPTYTSFCVDRSERLDHYFANHGPGWLWHEPPLADSETDALAQKGLCLDRRGAGDAYGVGSYPITLEFTIQASRVSRLPAQSGGKKKEKRLGTGDASCQVETLLDSGATFPVIIMSDLLRLNVDLSAYPAQGVMQVSTVGSKQEFKFFEMYVSVCSKQGSSLVSQGQEAVWPTERRALGGFYPVLVYPDPKGTARLVHRLSGMVPFDACYLSSAPGMTRLWLGEDRRDVLGTNRLPAHQRFDTDRRLKIEYPREFEVLRGKARTPDRVVFLHEFPEYPGVLLTDSDSLGTRGKSELAIGQYQEVSNVPGQKDIRKALPKRVIEIEPRKGGIRIAPKYFGRTWTKHFGEARKPITP
ncbi:hypothetical protein F5Y14DRAFT_461443 [Nemania sp. NC0429]|nr:hypothetical protein F5Y14DRAFT_461443 [Nemania sp. NC0429]